MPPWRCPHCATPQPPTARCWVCHRSTTSCATCAHFRRGVAAGLGFCALDRRRLALRGDEIRSCWSGRDEAPGVATAGAPESRATRRGPDAFGSGAPGGRTFVPVGELQPPDGGARPQPPEPRWSLWGDPEA